MAVSDALQKKSSGLVSSFVPSLHMRLTYTSIAEARQERENAKRAAAERAEQRRVKQATVQQKAAQRKQALSIKKGKG